MNPHNIVFFTAQLSKLSVDEMLKFMKTIMKNK